MKMFSTTRRKIALGAVGIAACLGAGGTAYAATSGDSPSAPATPVATAAPTASTSSPATGAARTVRRRRLLARADHATAELKVKGHWVTYAIDRGKVTSAGATSITLARPDGQSVTDTIDASTKFRGVTSASGLVVGREATAMSTGGRAIRVAQKPSATAG